jgi:hypothetical protein
MNNELSIFHKTLFLELRPWSIKEFSEAKFIELTQQVKKEFYSFQPLYQVDLPKPLTARRKYYHALIENEAIRYLNAFHQEMSAALNDEEKKYLVHTTLSKLLIQKLNETSAIINEYQYFFINVSGPSKSTGSPNIGDDSYTLQFLKYQLIRIYLEIQYSYKDFVKGDSLSEVDIQQLYFSEPPQEKSIIIESPITIHKQSEGKQMVHKVVMPFKVLKADFREPEKGIIDYKTIIKNDQRFALFEEQLCSHGYIDENYSFVNKHGLREEMAMIYHILISRNYFNPRRFNPNKPIQHLDIRKFLDHRYNASLDKQFRSYNKASEKIVDFVSKHRWLDILPSC